MSDIVLVRNLRKRIGSETILKDISLSLPSVGFIGILGPSGCGKTTLLNILSGIDGSFKGSVTALGRSLSGMDEDSRSDFRLKEIGYVTQFPTLLELENVISNVTLPLETLYADSNKNILRKANDALRFVGMEKKGRRRVNSLSGGEKARVAFARAIANDPKIILADEPTGALDGKNSEIVFSLLKKTSLRRLVVVVSHDEDSVRKYADRIIHMKDGEIIDDETMENVFDGNPPASIRLGYIKNTPSLSGFTLFRHARSVMKARRIRKYISTAMISIGLLGLGLATYIYFSIEEQVNRALSSFIADSCLIIEKANSPSSPYSNIYAASMETAKGIYNDNKEITGYGVSLITDYENVFPNENDFYIYREGKPNIHLDGFSARSINDFLWIENDTMVYPHIERKMEMNEVVLGLPFDYMFSLSFTLGSMRDYTSLGNFLIDNRVSMYLYLSNIDAEFQNDDMFDIVGVVESKVPCLYHTNTLWNYDYFIKHLHFYPRSNSVLENMQQMFALPYFGYKEGVEDYIKKNRANEKLSSIIYEPFKPSFLPSLEDEENPLDLKRLYLYYAAQYGISETDMEDLRTFCPSIKGVLPGSSGGYYASSSSMLTGFSNRFFLSNEMALAKEIGETCSIMKKEDADLPLNLPTGAVSGELSSGSSGVKLVAGVNSFDFGSSPTNIDEVCLSSSLYNALGSPSTVYVSYEKSKETIDDIVLRDFSYASLKVVGIKREEKPLMYVSSYWTYDYPLCRLGASGFKLEPNGAVLCFENDSEASKCLDSLSSRFPSFVFFHPAKEISKTIGETTSYIGAVLIAFSLLALSVASVLFLTVMSITIEESKPELDMFYSLGLSKADRIKSVRMFVLNQTLTSFIPSLLILTVLEVVVHIFICKMFAVTPSFPLSWPPFAAMSVAAIFFYLLLSFAVYVSLHRQK